MVDGCEAFGELGRRARWVVSMYPTIRHVKSESLCCRALALLSAALPWSLHTRDNNEGEIPTTGVPFVFGNN